MKNQSAIDRALPENLSVLFVDDDAILRKLFIRSVRGVCPTWTIRGAISGEAALKLIRDQQAGDEEQGMVAPSIGHFDLVFVDQYMASSTKTERRSLLGTETVAAMRAGGVDAKICGLSANDMRLEFITAGADCFMLKPLPCDKDALERELLRVLGIVREEGAIL